VVPAQARDAATQCGHRPMIPDDVLVAMIMVPAVGWTSASEVHRIPRRRWWTALRLSTLRCPVAGMMTKAVLVTNPGRPGVRDRRFLHGRVPPGWQHPRGRRCMG